MDKNTIIIAIVALVLGILGGYYYSQSKVEGEVGEAVDQEVLEQVNPFSDENINTNPYQYVNPFE